MSETRSFVGDTALRRSDCTWPSATVRRCVPAMASVGPLLGWPPASFGGDSTSTSGKLTASCVAGISGKSGSSCGDAVRGERSVVWCNQEHSLRSRPRGGAAGRAQPARFSTARAHTRRPAASAGGIRDFFASRRPLLSLP